MRRPSGRHSPLLPRPRESLTSGVRLAHYLCVLQYLRITEMSCFQKLFARKKSLSVNWFVLKENFTMKFSHSSSVLSMSSTQLFEICNLRFRLTWLDHGKVVYTKHVWGSPLFRGMSLSIAGVSSSQALLVFGSVFKPGASGLPGRATSRGVLTPEPRFFWKQKSIHKKSFFFHKTRHRVTECLVFSGFPVPGFVYCAPLVCVPDVIEGLAVWWHKNKKNVTVLWYINTAGYWR